MRSDLTLAVAAFAIFAAPMTWPAEPATTFTHLGPEDGLPSRTAWAVTQDAQGYIWIGTHSGLVRYDGIEMTVYRNDPQDPRSLVHDEVYDLLVDRRGSLWAATGAGVARYDVFSDSFDRFTIDLNNPDTPEELSVMAIEEGPDGAIWAAGVGSLIRVDPFSGQVTRYSIEPDPATGLRSDPVYALHVDRAGRIWLGSMRGPITRITPGSSVVERFDLGPLDESQHHRLHEMVRAIHEDDFGSIWVGTNAGLNRLDPVNGSRQFYAAFHPLSLPAFVRRRLVGDFDRNAYEWDSRGLTSHAIRAIFEDSTGNLWIGTTRDLIRYDHATDRFSTSTVRAKSDTDPGFFIGVNSIYQDRNGLLWFAGYGVDRLDLTSEQFVRYDAQEISLPSVSDDFVEESGVVWSPSPNGGGLQRRPGRNGEEVEVFRHDQNDERSLSHNFTIFVYEDSRGRFWVGTHNGVDLFDRETGLTTRYLVGSQAPFQPYGTSLDPEIRAVAEAADGSLWFATDRGIARLNAAATQVQYFTAADGLAHDRVNAVVFDQQGYLWAGTEGGLSRLNPATGQFRNFFIHHGLPSNEVLDLQIAYGELFVSTYGYPYVSVRTEVLADRGSEPEIGVAGLALLSGRGPVDDDDSRSVPNAARSTMPSMTLTHRDRVVNFDLAVLDYSAPERNRYAYMLEGLDTEWIYAEGMQRRATYTTLPAGSYRFLYRGADSTGRWSEAPDAIELTVLPAPWLSPWAYALYSVAAMLTFIALVVLRTRAATRRAQELEATVETRTRELGEQRDTIEQQSERLKEVAATKDRLYANVSHEFRTPLTVILGPLDRLLQREQAPNRRSHLETIRRNARRLLRLVEQLLDLARIDAARVADPSPQPAGARVNVLVESFRTLAEDNGIQLSSDCDPKAWVSCDPDGLEKIVINLVSNAIKFTPSGQVRVTVKTLKDERVEITVTDTGVGIPKHEQANVFERFYRATDLAEGTPGSGLGLALVKELVNANRGEIDLSSEEQVGTTIRVRLPGAPASDDRLPVAAESDTTNLEVSLLRPLPTVEPLDSEETTASRALIIEDNQDLCRHVGAVLGEEFKCDFAHDGESGLQLGIDTVPDVIICDVMLPKMNGLEVVRQLKQDDRTCHIPVILLTARADEESRLAGLRTLADDYVTKPFSESELLQRVETLLSIREILRQRYAQQLHSRTQKPLPEMSERDRRFLDRAGKALAENHSIPEFSLAQLASLLAMSERQLQRKFKALTNNTPREYIRSFRLNKAMSLLEAGQRVSDVAFDVGFTSQSYFASCFRAQFGMTPSQVRHPSDEQRVKSAD